MGRYRRAGDDAEWTIERPSPDRLVIIEPDGTQREEQLTTATAQTRFNVLVNQHVRAGWKLVQDEAVAGAPKPPTTYGARNPELEAAIVADPLAIDPRLIYGDWLQAQGDPRGEHIARTAAAVLDPRLEDRLDQMMTALRLRRYFFGTLIERDDVTPHVRWGFVDRLDVFHEGETDRDEMRAILEIDEARLVTEISYVTDSAEQLARSVRTIASHAPATLRTLALANRISFELRLLAPRIAKLSSLRLDVLVPRDSIRDLPVASELRAFEILVADNALVTPLVGWLEHAPKLEELRFRNRSDAAWLHRIADGPLASRLVTLGFENVTPPVAEAVLSVREAFPRLRKLVGSHALLTTELCYELGDLL